MISIDYLSSSESLSLSSSIFDANMGAATLYLLLLAGLMHDFEKGVDNLLGVAPFLTGVFTGKSLLNCSGLSTGPKETLLLFLLLDLGV